VATRHYRLRIRSAADDADALVLSSVPSDTNPHLTAEPSGDGQRIDPAVGRTDLGVYTVRAIDALRTEDIESLYASDIFDDGTAETPAVGYVANTGSPATFFNISGGKLVITPGGSAGIFRWTAGDGAAGIEGGREWWADIEATAGIVTNSRVLVLARAKNVAGGGGALVEFLAVALQNTSSTLATLRAVRYAAGVQAENVAIAAGLAWATGSSIRLGFTLDDATGEATFWTEPLGGGARTEHGTHTFGATYIDSDHRRFGMGGSGVGTFSIEAQRGYTLTPNEYRVITRELVDADGRQTLAHRRAYIELSEDAGGSWPTVLLAGYINGYRLVSALEWEFNIGESQRVEQTRKVFDRTTLNFEGVTCLFGGPVRGGWGPLRDYGGWTFKVTAVDADLVTLQFVTGFLPITNVLALWQVLRNALSDWSRERVTRVIHNDPKTIVNGVVVYDDMTVKVETMAGADVDRFSPAVQVDLDVRLFDFSSVTSKLDKLQVLREGTAWQASPPNVDDQFRIYMWREVISEENPLHIDMHPVDVITALWDDSGVPWDAATAATVRTALGDDTRITLRITESYVQQDFLQMLFGLLGIAARRGTDGEMELYISRVRNLTPPVNTYDDNDLRNPDTVIFELDESTIYNTVVTEQHIFGLWSPASGATRPMDDIVSVPVTHIVELDSDGDGTPDAATDGLREARFTIPGALRLAASGFDELPAFVAEAIAAELFDRWGRGGVFGAVEALPALTELVGQELLLDVSHLPNAGVRGGTRVLQVVQRTESPAGPVLRLLDSGPDSQFATSPTFSLAASATKPKKVVDVTITNQAALQSADAWLRVEWAVAGVEPTAGLTLVAYQPADVPASFATPPVDAGSNVWVRMQAFRPGQRPTAWTAWQNVDLADLTAPSNVTQTQDADDDGITVVSWDVGEASVPVEVYRRTQGAAAETAEIAALLPAGTTQVSLNLVPGSSYTIGVRHREASPFGGSSATTEISFTVAGSAPTLGSPAASAFSLLGGLDVQLFNWVVLPDAEAIIGVCAEAETLPSLLEVEMATETAVGSGTPGAFALVATLPAAENEQSTYRTTAPIDGKLRYFRVRSVRDAAVASAYSPTVNVMPGVPKACNIPAVRAVQLFVNDAGTVRATVLTTGRSARIAVAVSSDPSDDTAFPSEATTQAATLYPSDGFNTVVTPGLVTLSPGETAYVSVLAYEDADGGQAESVGVSKDRVTFGAGALGGVTLVPQVDGWSASQNAAAPENGVSLITTPSEAFSNLEDANARTTTYTVTYDIQNLDGLEMSRIDATVDIYVNDGPGSTNWTLVATKTYFTDQGTVSLLNEQLSFGVALDADWDLRCVFTFNALEGNHQLALHGENDAVPGVIYNRVEGGFDPGLITGSEPDPGDTLFANASAEWDVMPGNATTTRKFWRQVGDGAIPGDPGWDTILAADVTAGSFQNAGYTFPNTLVVGGLLTAQAGLTVSGGSISASGIAATVGALTATTGAFSGALSVDASGASFVRRDGDTTESNTWGLKNLAPTAAVLHGVGLHYKLADTSGTELDAGRLSVQKKQEWTSTATTRDAIFRLWLALDGSLSQRFTLDPSAGLASFPSDNLLLGTTTPAPGSPRLDVVGGQQLALANVTTDATLKVGTLSVRHYTNIEEPIAAVRGLSSATQNYVMYGGLDTAATYNAATIHQWYTAANQTTLGGTLAADLTGVGTAAIFYSRGQLKADRTIVAPASAAGYASLSMAHGTAPSSPNNGDLWTTTAGLFARISGTTVGPFIDTAGAHTLGSHSDVTITAIAAGELLKWNGSVWINNTLVEAGIAAASHTHAASDITAGTFGSGNYTFPANLIVTSLFGVGTTSVNVGIYLPSSVSIPGSAGNAYGVFSNPTFASSVTTAGRAMFARVQTQAAAFTMAAGTGVYIASSILGSGSAITTLYGLYVEGMTTGGTNYAIYTNAGDIRFGGTIVAGTWQGTAIAAAYLGAHNHAAADINSGNLAYARLPTGSDSWDVGVGNTLTLPRLVRFGDSFGYATGVGGTVTQLTSKSTGVTLNTLCGQITTHNAAMTAGSEVSFLVTNSTVVATDLVIVNLASGGTTNTYVIGVEVISAGSFRILIENISSVGRSEALVLNFAVIKAVNA